jgi:uncharacterized protein YycO
MDIKPGDVMFEFHPWSIMSEIIAFYTFPVLFNGELHHISHAEMIVDVGNEVQVLSAEAEGMTPEWKILKEIPFWVIKDCHTLTDMQRKEILRWAWAHQGVPYNFLGLLAFPMHVDTNSKNALYCSQACYSNYLLEIDDHFKDPQCDGVKLLSDVAWCSPAHLFTSPLLIPIGGSV